MTYRLFIDEVGNDKMSRFEHASNRFLSLTGIIMNGEVVRGDLEPRLEHLKETCFSRDSFDDLPVLHRSEIVTAPTA